MSAGDSSGAFPVHQADIYRYGITAAIIVVIMALRFRNVGKMRRLRLETLWIVPAIYLAVAIATFVIMPPVGIAWAYIAVGVTIGGVVGWQRGKLMHIAVDPETHTLNQRTSPAALIFIVAIVLVRNAASILASKAGLSHAAVLTLTDVLIAFALGMFTMTRVEMYLRAKRLLGKARQTSPA